MAISELGSPPEGLAPAERWYEHSVMVTFAFHCNVACTFCMVEDVLGELPGTSLEEFERRIAEPGGFEGVRRIIFSGGEVTLSDRLVDYARAARRIPGVEHVRIQTNATRLGRRDKIAELMDAGIDEYFVSVHGHEETLVDGLLQKKGAFRAMVAGLEAIRSAGASLITNTAIVAPNAAHLPAIVEFAAGFGPRSVELWNYWPRGDESGARDLCARVPDVQGPLMDALRRAIQRGIPPVVKWFPRCLLGDLGWTQDDGQPPAMIDDRYFEREPRYGCLYSGVCADGPPRCSGLSFPYIERFGWEERLLTPRRTRPAGTERGEAARSLTEDATEARGDRARVARWLDSLGVRSGASFAGYGVAECAATRDGREVVVRLRAASGDVLEVRLRPRDDARPASVRTASFDLLTAKPAAARAAAQSAALRELARVVVVSDGGNLSLP